MLERGLTEDKRCDSIWLQSFDA